MPARDDLEIGPGAYVHFWASDQEGEGYIVGQNSSGSWSIRIVKRLTSGRWGHGDDSHIELRNTFDYWNAFKIQLLEPPPFIQPNLE